MVNNDALSVVVLKLLVGEQVQQVVPVGCHTFTTSQGIEVIAFRSKGSTFLASHGRPGMFLRAVIVCELFGGSV